MTDIQDNLNNDLTAHKVSPSRTSMFLQRSSLNRQVVPGGHLSAYCPCPLQHTQQGEQVLQAGLFVVLKTTLAKESALLERSQLAGMMRTQCACK